MGELSRTETPRDAGTYALTSCRELAEILTALPLLLREARRQRGLNLRDAAGQIGIGHTTVARIERGEDTVLSTAIAVIRWLDAREAKPERIEGAWRG